MFFNDFYRKKKKFGPKKYKIMKKLKILTILKNFVIWFCELLFFQNFENTPKLARFAKYFY